MRHVAGVLTALLADLDCRSLAAGDTPPRVADGAHASASAPHECCAAVGLAVFAGRSNAPTLAENPERDDTPRALLVGGHDRVSGLARAGPVHAGG